MFFMKHTGKAGAFGVRQKNKQNTIIITITISIITVTNWQNRKSTGNYKVER